MTAFTGDIPKSEEGELAGDDNVTNSEDQPPKTRQRMPNPDDTESDPSKLSPSESARAKTSSEENPPNLSNSRPERRDTVKRSSEALSSFATARNVFSKFGQGAGSGKGQGSSGDGDEFDLEEELVMTWKLPEDGIEAACDEAEMDELRGKCEVIGLFIFRYFNVRKHGGVRFPSFADHHFISIFFSPQDLIYSCIRTLSRK